MAALLHELTEAQAAAVDRFVDLLLDGEHVSWEDFPEMPRADFEEMANAVLLDVFEVRH